MSDEATPPCGHAFCAKHPHLAAIRHELEADNFGSVDQLRATLDARDEELFIARSDLSNARSRAVRAEGQAQSARELLLRWESHY
jgi:hypothetical protein